MLQFLESDLFSSGELRKTKTNILPSSANTKVCFESPANDVADTQCQHSLKHGQTIDTLNIAYFALHQEIWTVYDSPYKI